MPKQDGTTPPPPPAPPRREGWSEEEKARGTAEGLPPDAAGEAESKGRPSDDREETEGAAAATERQP